MNAAVLQDFTDYLALVDGDKAAPALPRPPLSVIAGPPPQPSRPRRAGP